MQKNKKTKIRLVLFIVCIVLIVITVFLGIMMSSFEIQKVDDYLYYLEGEKYDVSLATYISNLGLDVVGCSVVRKDNIVGRNLDWEYDDEAEFIVHVPATDSRYESIGLASLTGINPDFVDKKIFTPTYLLVPLFTVDGINENGVFACINDVPAEDITPTTQTSPGQSRLCSAVLVRYILDNAADVDEAIELIKEKDIFSYNSYGNPHELHLMIADREKTVIVEFIDNEIKVLDGETVMTNYFQAKDGYTAHSRGIERYNILKEEYESVKNENDMKSLMEKVYFSNLYDISANPFWYSDFYGMYNNEDGKEFTYFSDVSEFESVLKEKCNSYAHTQPERNSGYQITTHTSIYNLDTLTLSVASEETGIYHDYTISVKTDAEIQQAQNNSTKIIIIPLEVMCLLFQFIILYGLYFENNYFDKKSKYFTLTVLMTILATGADILTWTFDGIEAMTGVQAATNIIAMLMNDLLTLPFILYEYEYIRERKKDVKIWPVNAVVAFNYAACIFIIIETVKGNTFYFQNGVFMTGKFYSVSIYFAVVNLIAIIGILLSARKELGNHDATVLSAYILIPFITVLYELANPILELGFVAVTLALFLIYILLQAGKTKELEMRETLLKELCELDQLTSLNNRRAYDRAIDSFIYSERSGAIFCDVNGLKYTNDSFGHQAGDDLLTRFADILKANFNYNDIYRISGDEFVAFVPDVSEEEFNIVFGQFEKVMSENNNIASIGGAYNEKGIIIPVLDLAETRMYDDKEKYHLSHPEQQRR